MCAAADVGGYGNVYGMCGVYMVAVYVVGVWASDDGIAVSVMPIGGGGYYSVEYGVYDSSYELSLAVAGVGDWSRVVSGIGVIVSSV